MSIQLAALDLDGTTLQNNHLTVSRKNQQGIRKAIARGVWIVPATGRTLSEIPMSLRQIPGIRYAVTSNGACVYDLKSGKPLFENLIPPQTAAAVFDIIARYPVYAELYCDGKAYVERRKFSGLMENFLQELVSLLAKRTRVNNLSAFVRGLNKPVEKIELMPKRTADTETLQKKLKTMPVAVTTSGRNSIEISNLGASKGSALAFLCDLLHIDAKDVMAVGDSCNDLEMLQFAGFSVAVENADPSVQKIAGFIVPRSSRNGVAVALERLILHRKSG